ncbi:MAG: hypothetical protein ACRDSZ_12720 [Pseudonocardiaceae bacterium]
MTIRDLAQRGGSLVIGAIVVHGEAGGVRDAPRPRRGLEPAIEDLADSQVCCAFAASTTAA